MDIKKAYNFCPRCGSKFDRKGDYLNCPSCGLNFYINPKACNGLVLKNKQGYIMFVERAVEPKKGLWDVPGGFVDADETFEESMRREVKEELGTELADLEYAGSWTDSYEYQSINYPTLCVMFIAEIDNTDDIKPADDVASYQFFKPSELPYDRFAFPWMEKFFRSYIKN